MKSQGEVKEFLCVTPANTTNIEGYTTFLGNNDFTIELYEGTTTSNNGTSVSNDIVNQCRSCSATATLDCYINPTVTSSGKLIWTQRSCNNVPFGIIPPDYSLQTKSNTKYLWRVTKNNSQTHYLNINFWWKETRADV
jgi:hypothetical protein